MSKAMVMSAALLIALNAATQPLGTPKNSTHWSQNFLRMNSSTQAVAYLGLTNYTGTSPTGGVTAAQVDLQIESYLAARGKTTNFAVVFATGETNTLSYSNGLLVAISSMVLHGPSLALPGGGYLLQPNGSSSLLLP